MPNYTRRVRKTRTRTKTRHRGGIRFSNNTKNSSNSNNSNNFTNLPVNHLNTLYSQLRERMPPVSNTHQLDASIFADIKSKYNDPVDMKEELRHIYTPMTLSDKELDFLRQFANPSESFTKLINRVQLLPLQDDVKTRILNRLRYELQIKRVQKTYEREYPERFSHPEWNEVPQN